MNNFAVAMDNEGYCVAIPPEIYEYYQKNLLPRGWIIIANPVKEKKNQTKI